MQARILVNLATITLTALIALSLAWELWLAPLRPGGSWMVLKVLPLMIPLRGILHGRRYTFQWTSMLILAYFAEGVVRAISDRGLSASLAGIEIFLSLLLFGTTLIYARVSAPSKAKALV